MDSVIEEVQLIGPAYKRQPDAIHGGFWTPELAEWREQDGFREIRDLQSYTWSGSVKVTGAEVNASPMLCVVKAQVGHVDLDVNVTYSIGVPDPNENVVSGNTTISGFTLDYQYNEPVYRRAWVTGGTAGFFKSTYGFENDNVGDEPAGWTPNNGAGCTTTIVSSIDGHNKVLNISDTNAGTLCSITTPAWAAVADNTIELWFRIDNIGGTRAYVISGYEGALAIWHIIIDDDNLQYYDGLYHDIKVDYIVANRWYHIKIVADDTAKTYDFYLDDILEASDLEYDNDTTIGITKITFNTRVNATIEPYNFYIHGVGITSDPDYTVGDNLEDGINPFTYQFTVPAYTKPGQVYKLPNKRTYKINDISVSGAIASQPVARLGFYALADNGSKLLYSMNWNKIFEYSRDILYGAYGNPAKCARCDGTGYIGVVANTCQQCDGYKYNGPNATEYLEQQVALDYNLIKDDDSTNEEFRNKIWAMNWWVTPTKKEIQRYFAHFARIEDEEIEVNNIDRLSTSGLPTGVEKVVDLLLPYNIPFSVFDKSDKIWTQMVESIEPAGIPIRFSFLIDGFSGIWEWDELDSIYPSGYINGELSGLQLNRWVYGHANPLWNLDHGSNSFYSEWGEDFHFFNHLCESIHVSGYISGCSGIQLNSGATYTWSSGAMEGAAWLSWVEVSGSAGGANIWDSGDGTLGFVQDALWVSGTYYWDNFWSSGVGSDVPGLQY